MPTIFQLADSQPNIRHFYRASNSGTVSLEAASEIMPLAACRQAWNTITAWEKYSITPLYSFQRLAQRLGISEVHCKDESKRFELASFKAQGGAYAVYKQIADHLKIPVIKLNKKMIPRNFDFTAVTATDGNHGRSVAWGASQLGIPCKIYMHEGVSEFRAEAVRLFEAEVIRVAGTYDDSVHQADKDSKTMGWHIISDTSYPGYLDTPKDIMHGYSVMCSEIEQQIAKPPTHVFISAGCGGMAGAVIGYFSQVWPDNLPHWIIVEPDRAPSLYLSAQKNKPSYYAITEETLMGGLSCGEISIIAWEILSEQNIDYLQISDDWVQPAMRYFGSCGLVAGETSAASLAALTAVCLNKNLRAFLSLNENSRPLIFSTEGATDPEIYAQLMGFEAKNLPHHIQELIDKEN